MADNKYKDIINLEHHVSVKHKQMSLHDRAAQFASFAALTGFEESVNEVARKTERRIELDDYRKEEIIEKVLDIAARQSPEKHCGITWFEKDSKKEGGKYVSADVRINNIDIQNGIIYFNDSEKLNVEDIYDISVMGED